MNTHRPRQHGYVLLLTLVMVALVSAGTVGLTRASLASATEASVRKARQMIDEQGDRLFG